MRRVYRIDLPRQARQNLFSREKSATSESARSDWDAYRRSAASRPVIQTLREMTGARQRCVYCCDSRSADVDHFIPIAVDFTKAFRWSNLIWVCPECNRKKGARFPRGKDGNPLLINPVDVNPWDHLVLDTANGYLAPRFMEDDFDA